MKKLIIIEGAGKIAKIKSYLGSDYDVMATGGHFRELKNDGLYNTGITSDYSPSFQFSKSGSSAWKRIKEAIAKNNYETVYIASDPDREGEAIGWHIYQNLPANAKKVSQRITYNEITKSAIEDALKHPRAIDAKLVDAQFARQGYDKIFGFRASNYVQRNLNLKSIGRIQGVAVKFLGDRAKEIANYQPHYKNEVNPTVKDNQGILRTLNHIDKKTDKIIRYEKNETIPNIENPFVCENIDVQDTKSERPYEPYITSTLLTDATRSLGLNAKSVQAALQELYQKGYASYPRTDSKALSDTFFKELQIYLKQSPYASHVRSSKQLFKNAASSQEGHECLRITHPEIKPSDPKIQALGVAAIKVYNLLYKRTLIQGLKDAEYQNINYYFNASNELFKIGSKKYNYLGWRNYPDYTISNELPDFTEDKAYIGKIEVKEVNVNPKPAPYTEASLIKELEKRQIGRPSTYATFPAILQDRKYATLKNKEFVLTNEGTILYQAIEANFKDFINYDFTKEFEADLDKIASGLLAYQPYLAKKDHEIDSLVAKKISDDLKQEIKATKQGELSDKYCETCQTNRTCKTSSNGNKYYVCANFKWNPKTKTASGCPIEWENKPFKKTFKKKTNRKIK